jgi:hypothetical protein
MWRASGGESIDLFGEAKSLDQGSEAVWADRVEDSGEPERVDQA